MTIDYRIRLIALLSGCSSKTSLYCDKMKRSEIFFNAILVPIDFIFIVVSALLAYYLRFHPLITEQKPVLYKTVFLNYMSSTFLVAGFVVLVFAFEGLYSMKTTRSKLQEVYKIFSATSTALLILIIALFLNREYFSSRFVILASWTFAIISTSLARIMVGYIQGLLAVKKGLGVHRVLVIGKNNISQAVIEQIKRKKLKGYRVIANIEDFDWDELKRTKERKGIDEIIQCDPNLLRSKMGMLVRFSDIYKIDYKYVPNLFETHATNITVRQFAGFPLIELNKTSLDGWGKVIKRIFDIVFSLAFVIVFSPIYLLIALAIKLDSPGKVIYTDYRCGYKKRKFKFYKFRSLYSELCDGEFGTKKGNKMLKELAKDQKKNTRSGPLHKIKDDPRITRVGKFIRKYSLDELPQFFNVIKGDMSVVGYRPHMTYEVDKFTYDQQKMFYIKPGITGLAQISGRSDLDFDEEVKLDVYYMENWSLLMDIAIILKTPFVLFKRRKAD